MVFSRGCGEAAVRHMMALPIEVPKICGLKNPFKKICLCLCQYMYFQTFQKYNMLVPCCNILRGLEIYLQITLQWVAFGRLCKTGGEGTFALFRPFCRHKSNGKAFCCWAPNRPHHHFTDERLERASN